VKTEDVDFCFLKILSCRRDGKVLGEFVRREGNGTAYIVNAIGKIGVIIRYPSDGEYVTVLWT
jgi:hypothetical protein